MYHWIITADLIETGSSVEGVNCKGVTGPRESDFDWKTNPDAGEAFAMYDDDGELYYRGRITGDYEGFEPLDDFGMPYAGCTSIKYRNPKTGQWETL